MANKSQQWSRSLLDLPVSHDTERELGVMKQVAGAMWHDDAWSDAILEEPEIWGAEGLGTER